MPTLIDSTKAILEERGKSDETFRSQKMWDDRFNSEDFLLGTEANTFL